MISDRTFVVGFCAIVALSAMPRAATAADAGPTTAPATAPATRSADASGAHTPPPKVISLGPPARPLPPASKAPLQLVRVFVHPAAIGDVCRGEFAVRNNGPDIAPDAKSDLFVAEIVIRGKGGGVRFQNRWARVGTGIGRGEIISGSWDTKFNALMHPTGVYPRFVIPSAGEYELTITLTRPGNAAPLDTSVQRFDVPDTLPAKADAARLTVTRLSVAPAAAGQPCAGELDVRNEGPALPAGKDLFKATVEVFNDAAVPIYRGYVSRAGTKPMAAGEVLTIKWDTGANALDRSRDGLFQRFTIPRPGKYIVRVTVGRDDKNAPLDSRDLLIHAPAAGAPLVAAPPAAQPPAAVPPAPAQPKPRGVRLTRLTVQPAVAGDMCFGEFVARNDGPDIAAADDAFHATIEVSDAEGSLLYRAKMSRRGSGTPAGKSVYMKWQTDNNDLTKVPDGASRRFVLPRAGDYVATVTLTSDGRADPLDVRKTHFHAADRPARPAGADPVAASLPADARPVALRVLDSRLDHVNATAPVSGRFVVRNVAGDYVTPAGLPPPTWRVTVQDEDRRPLFRTSGAWGPGLRASEEIEIAWDTRRNELDAARPGRFVLPEVAYYGVLVEVFAQDADEKPLHSRSIRVFAPSPGR